LVIPYLELTNFTLTELFEEEESEEEKEVNEKDLKITYSFIVSNVMFLPLCSKNERQNEMILSNYYYEILTPPPELHEI
jgi:predicted ribosome quality control (RQC) complex YloA/Tae2 family protein